VEEKKYLGAFNNDFVYYNSHTELKTKLISKAKSYVAIWLKEKLEDYSKNCKKE